ncbi:mannitol dehydrogenase family protein [Olivibacter sitiensis]|uniref:mannitol dehydrogenase family protein n=1 Tax=Olivibacter sitiensis TaxID=376470 RepID=UPI000417B12A|nr:mannitol dehydrogenase family protein [Olivibacter sitiensis]
MIKIQHAIQLDLEEVNSPNYHPEHISPGIVHIGVGNFHRAHQAYYADKFLNESEDNQWGIVGLSITGSGAKMSEKMEKQNYLYTLTEYDADGSSEVHILGAIIDYIAGKDEPEKAFEQLADPAIKIVSLTITEGRYLLNKDGELPLDDSGVQHDLQHPKEPTTAFGYIVEALDRRRKNGAGPFTVLSCDNLQHNGDVTRKVVLSFAKARNEELYEWIKENVTFPNSMVDRITPSIDKEDQKKLNKESGIEDVIPVYTEKFTQWVIEDKFCAGRPQWELAGVTFTDDVSLYETLKLRFLNAAHSMLAYPAFLVGYRQVDEAIQDAHLKKYIEDFMNKDVSPMVEVPEEMNLKKYKESLLERFSNEAVSDQLARLCYAGGAKIPVFIIPTLLDLLQEKRDTSRIAFLFAAYAHYLKEQKDDKGEAFVPDAPTLSEEDRDMILKGDSKAIFEVSPFKEFHLEQYLDLVAQYEAYRERISKEGTLAVLKSL